MPDLFGGSVKAFNGAITIGPKGITIAGQQAFDLPDFTLGTLQIKRNMATVIFSDDNKFQVAIISRQMVVNISGGGGGMANDVKILLDANGIRSGQIGYFEVSGFAGNRNSVLQDDHCRQQAHGRPRCSTSAQSLGWK